MNSIIIADFGLASYLDEQNLIIKRCGTPGYIDPEILEKVLILII
jgi:serine/threonine protein kinase